MFNPVYESPFYPGMFGPNTQAELRKHKVWPLIVALKMEFNLYLQGLSKPNEDSTRYLLCDGTGLRQAKLFIDADEEISLCIMKNSFSALRADTEELFKSKNIKYLLGRINKLRGEPDSLLNKLCTRGITDFNQYMNEMTSGFLSLWDGQQGRSRYTPSLDGNMRIKAIKVLDGTLTKSDLSPSELVTVKFEMQRIVERHEKHEEYKKKVLNYLSGPKFMFIYDNAPISSLVFGALKFTNIEDMMDSFYESDGHWYVGPQVQIEINHDFRRLKVLSSGDGSVLPALPIEFRDVVMSTLHLDKMNRSSKVSFDNTDPLFPSISGGFARFTDSSSFCWKSASVMSNVLIIPDKRGLLA